MRPPPADPIFGGQCGGNEWKSVIDLGDSKASKPSRAIGSRLRPRPGCALTGRRGEINRTSSPSNKIKGALLEPDKMPMPALPCLSGWMMAFGVVSLLDLVQTRLLIQEFGSAYEANPLAAVVLNQVGWTGMVLFKVGAVAAVLGLVLAIRRWRHRAALAVLRLGCAILVAVLAYGLLLAGSAAAERAEAAQLAASRQVRLQQMRRAERLAAMAAKRREQLAADLITHRLTLTQAARQLEAYLKEIGTGLSPALRAYCGDDLSAEACLAAHLIYEIVWQLQYRSDLARQQLRELRAQWAAAYRAKIPDYVVLVFGEAGRPSSPNAVLD
jgi:hypothetical protein